MDKSKRSNSPYHTFFPTEIEGFDSLAELALDMRWSWNHSADEVWKHLAIRGSRAVNGVSRLHGEDGFRLRIKEPKARYRNR